jgi:hypothetical protein
MALQKGSGEGARAAFALGTGDVNHIVLVNVTSLENLSGVRIKVSPQSKLLNVPNAPIPAASPSSQEDLSHHGMLFHLDPELAPRRWRALVPQLVRVVAGRGVSGRGFRWRSVLYACLRANSEQLCAMELTS